ncbi:(d)CMP kinase [Nocardia tenerifensis]|uniref:(d)CMP kinase n=1 Tax=Nocardia tenerifensis TaxID=228006 RepID=UPI0012F63EC5|nr:(d)CMP kinase [Nocardia tenerifensis]
MGIQPRRAPSRLVVAVDGGVATGKSSVCTEVARRLRLPYFNAGLLYRALALWCVGERIALDDADGIAAAAGSYPLTVSLDGGRTTILLMGRDVGDQLKTAEVGRAVPAVARHRAVRDIMNGRQRAIVRYAESAFGGVVIDGRDATTVVVPEADVKILLVATEEVRARRVGADEGAAADRDAADASVSDFLRPGPGVAVLDTSDLDIGELVSRVLACVREKRPDWVRGTD